MAPTCEVRSSGEGAGADWGRGRNNAKAKEGHILTSLELIYSMNHNP